MNNLEKVIKQLITVYHNEKDETQRRRLMIIIKELELKEAQLIDSSYLRAGYY